MISFTKTLFDGHEANRTATSKENQIIQKVSMSQNGLSVSLRRLQTIWLTFGPCRTEGTTRGSIVVVMVEDVGGVIVVVTFNEVVTLVQSKSLIVCWKSGKVSRQNETIERRITDTDITAITRAHSEDSGYSNNNQS